jgi:hypothetical protein
VIWLLESSIEAKQTCAKAERFADKRGILFISWHFDKADQFLEHLNRNEHEIVEKLIVRTGKAPAQFAGHSLRAGLATSAARVRVYIREGSLFRDNAAEGIGL